MWISSRCNAQLLASPLSPIAEGLTDVLLKLKQLDAAQGHAGLKMFSDLIQLESGVRPTLPSSVNRIPGYLDKNEKASASLKRLDRIAFQQVPEGVAAPFLETMRAIAALFANDNALRLIDSLLELNQVYCDRHPNFETLKFSEKDCEPPLLTDSRPLFETFVQTIATKIHYEPDGDRPTIVLVGPGHSKTDVTA